MSNQLPIYVINCQNNERRNRMKKRFSQLGIEPYFPAEVNTTDARLSNPPKHAEKRVWAIMLAHLDAIRHFYEQTQSLRCIVCEDDIHISKDLLIDLDQITLQFEQLQLDILLLGYLLPFKIDMNTHSHQQYFPVIDRTDKYVFHRYPDDLWGTQMYMISREYAKYLLEVYTLQYAINNIDKPYSSDWIITKNGNRAMIHPMMAVEEGTVINDCGPQSGFHKQCHLINYDPQKYL